jgi:hypothetical protein
MGISLSLSAILMLICCTQLAILLAVSLLKRNVPTRSFAYANRLQYKKGRSEKVICWRIE